MSEINLSTRKLFYGTDAQRLAQLPAEGMTYLVTDIPGQLIEYTGTGANLGDWQPTRIVDLAGNQIVTLGKDNDSAFDRQIGASVTDTAALILTLPDLRSYGYPYKSVIFTKSAAVESATITWQVVQGASAIAISGLTTETVALTATNESDNTIGAVAVVDALGAATAGSALGNGTYYMRGGF